MTEKAFDPRQTVETGPVPLVTSDHDAELEAVLESLHNELMAELAPRTRWPAATEPPVPADDEEHS